MQSTKPFITRHAVDRFKERFVHKYRDVDPNNFHALIDKIKQILEEAKENKSYLNDSMHLISLYEKYGYESQFRFMCGQGIVFVIAKDKKRDYVVTCYNQEEDKYIVKHTKFSGKKKIEKESENVISLEEAKAKGWNIGL